jgi:hypothetical protein
MGFRIDVKGIDEIQKRLNDLQKGLDPDTFNEWSHRVENTAKQICNDTDSKRIKLKHTQELGFSYEVSDKEAIDCLIDAVKQHLNSMPSILQEIYKTFMKELEGKKRQFDATKSE